MKTTRTILLGLLALVILQALYFYPRMPDVMASHFDGSGRPNGHQSRDGFFLLMGAMASLNVLIFMGLGPLFRWIPTTWFNLPNRDYWLAPERREETLDVLASRMEWFGIVTTLLLLAVAQMAYQANLETPPRIDNRAMWWALGIYFTFTAIWLVRFIARFRKPRSAP